MLCSPRRRGYLSPTVTGQPPTTRHRHVVHTVMSLRRAPEEFHRLRNRRPHRSTTMAVHALPPRPRVLPVGGVVLDVCPSPGWADHQRPTRSSVAGSVPGLVIGHTGECFVLGRGSAKELAPCPTWAVQRCIGVGAIGAGARYLLQSGLAGAGTGSSWRIQSGRFNDVWGGQGTGPSANPAAPYPRRCRTLLRLMLVDLGGRIVRTLTHPTPLRGSHGHTGPCPWRLPAVARSLQAELPPADVGHRAAFVADLLEQSVGVRGCDWDAVEPGAAEEWRLAGEHGEFESAGRCVDDVVDPVLAERVGLAAHAHDGTRSGSPAPEPPTCPRWSPHHWRCGVSPLCGSPSRPSTDGSAEAGRTGWS